MRRTSGLTGPGMLTRGFVDWQEICDLLCTGGKKHGIKEIVASNFTALLEMLAFCR